MKNKLFHGVVLFVSLALLSFGCVGEDGADGMDGADGDAYIAYTWVSINSISSNDPAIPQTIYNSSPYLTSPGTYNVVYESWDGTVWDVDYILWIDEGEPGEPGEPGTAIMIDGEDGADGADGADIWFELTLFSSGPTLYDWPSPSYLGKSIADSEELAKFSRTVGDNATGSKSVSQIELDYDLHLDAMSRLEPTVVSGSNGRWGYTMKYVQIK